MAKRIPKRRSQAILQSLAAGVVPRVGAEHIAVGRKAELEALLRDLDDIIAQGGASFRLIVGQYGSGKSFLLQLLRNYALKRNFVVADADLSPQKRLTGSKNEGLALYRELLSNMATKTRPDGNAFTALLEKWISDLQSQVLKTGIEPGAPEFAHEVQGRIYTTINEMEGMVHGFDFASVIYAYWRGHQDGDDARKSAATRWLRGEYSTKTEARRALGVRVIIDDSSWYDYIKLLAYFARQVGYKGLIIFIDEAVNLYNISHKVSRSNNYERLLQMLNDTLQGKAEYLGFLFGATPQMVADVRRGLFSYDALKTRLEDSLFARPGLRDMSGPLIRLDTLNHSEIFLLLQLVQEIHSNHYRYPAKLEQRQLEAFMSLALERVGADTLLTPRDILREFVSLLNLLEQNPSESFASLVGKIDFRSSSATAKESTDQAEEAASPYASFQI